MSKYRLEDLEGSIINLGVFDDENDAFDVISKGITRLELIDETGGTYVNLNVYGLILSLQDYGKTLKLFLVTKE